MNRRRLHDLIAWTLFAATATTSAQAALPSSTELTRSQGALQLNAPTAWNRGANGHGIVVAVIDTGVNAAHSDLSGQVVTGYNSITRNSATGDTNGHGTHVAGIIGARSNLAGMVGTAYNSRILPVKVFDANGRGTGTALSNGIRYTAGKAKILNMSLSAPGPVAEYELKGAVSRGQLIVAAAGNAGQANPHWPARFATSSWANGQIIAVGAVDANNRIASFSNRAGTTENFFLVARGTSVMSTYKTGYAYMSGTSMATPYVSGAAAAMWSYWPYLSAKQVAASLFRTATDLGAPGVDAVYGRGLVNLNKAMQPVGYVFVPTGNGGYQMSGTTYAAAGIAYASSLQNFARSGGFAMAVEDELGRDFQTNLAGAVMEPADMTLEGMFEQLDQRMNVTDEFLADGTRLTMAPATLMDETDPSSALPGGFALSMALANGDDVALGSNGFADRFFGLGAARFGAMPSLDATALGDPLFALVPAHSHLGYGYDLGQGMNLRVGLLSDGLEKLYDPADDRHQSGSSSLWTTELSQQTASRYVSVSVSQLREEQGLLGSEQDDLFSLQAPAITTAASVQGAWRIAPGLALAGRYTVGYTPAVQAGDRSMVSDVTGVRTDGFATGLIKSDAWRTGDRLSLTLSQPLRATSGTMRFDVPTGNNASGEMQFQTRGFDLETSGRELRTELSYVTPTGRDQELGVVLAHRQQPDHDANAADDTMAGVRWQMRF